MYTYDLNPYSLSLAGMTAGAGVPPATNGFALPSATGAAPAPAAAPAGTNLGFNLPTLQLGMQGLNTLGNLYGALQAGKLAREQLDFTKSITNTNLDNSIKSYNTSLEDRARSRGFTEGQSTSQIQDYINANRLTR